MYVQVTINLNPDESSSGLPGNAAHLAELILAAIGGDEDKDVVTVQLNDSGMAGLTPERSAAKQEEAQIAEAAEAAEATARE